MWKCMINIIFFHSQYANAFRSFIKENKTVVLFTSQQNTSASWILSMNSLSSPHLHSQHSASVFMRCGSWFWQIKLMTHTGGNSSSLFLQMGAVYNEFTCPWGDAKRNQGHCLKRTLQYFTRHWHHWVNKNGVCDIAFTSSKETTELLSIINGYI